MARWRLSYQLRLGTFPRVMQLRDLPRVENVRLGVKKIMQGELEDFNDASMSFLIIF